MNSNISTASCNSSAPAKSKQRTYVQSLTLILLAILSQVEFRIVRKLLSFFAYWSTKSLLISSYLLFMLSHSKPPWSFSKEYEQTTPRSNSTSLSLQLTLSVEFESAFDLFFCVAFLFPHFGQQSPRKSARKQSAW